MDMKICIIGAGISGIASAKEFIKKGYQVTILEKNSSIGGVWLTKSYKDCQVQNSKSNYMFSDVDWNKNVQQFPNTSEVLNYLHEVCKKYDIMKRIDFNVEVKNTTFNQGNNQWSINTNNGIYTCNHMIVASGFYTRHKHLPRTNPPRMQVLYSSDFSPNRGIQATKPSIFKDKSVVIVGNGPTGCDLATTAFKSGAKSVKILYRSNKWLLRRYLWGLFLAEIIIQQYLFSILKHFPISIQALAMKCAYYLIFVWGHGHFCKIGTPDEPIYRTNILMNEEILSLICNKEIGYNKVKTVILSGKKVVTDTGDHICDICVSAIGYHSDINFLGLDSIPEMYKHIIHPQMQNCGFIGFAASLKWPQVAETQAKWYIRNMKTMFPPETLSKGIAKIRNNKQKDYHEIGITLYEYLDDLNTE
jgi:dimethylaniline monooxygenase (N-oxide forming)